MHSRNNKQEERSLKVQELSQKADYSSLLTTGTKKADPDKFKKQNCQSDEFAECTLCWLMVYCNNVYKACRSHDNV